MKSQNLGNPIKYSGEWIKNPFSLEQNITQNDKLVSIKTSLPKRFFAGQELTVWVAGVKMKCIYVSDTQLEIISHNASFNVIQKGATVYVLNNFDAEYSEELVPKSQISNLERKFERALESIKHNFIQNILTYRGEFSNLKDVDSPKYGDIVKCGDRFWVFSKVMLSCVIEKVTENELTITFIGNTQSYIKDACIINDITYTLSFKKQESDKMITYTYESSGNIPSVSDPVFVSEWNECIVPVFYVSKIISALS